MTTPSLEHVALLLGIVGLGCFVWPILRRITDKAAPADPVRGQSLRSPLWWAGFVLTAAAIFLQRVAAQQAGV